MSVNTYENFRTVLAVNLCSMIHDSDQLAAVMQMVDVTMQDYEISRKPVEIIPATGIPEVVRYFLASKAIAHLSQGTIKQYNYKLLHFFSHVNKPYTDIQANDIRVYLYAYKAERNASDRYLDNIRIVLNTFFCWLVDNEYLSRNPCAKVDKIKYQEKRRQPLSTLNLENLRISCENIREKALIDFLYSTGCRVSECADILLSDINWENNSVLIRHGKGDKQRTVYFNDESKVTLREYIKSRGDITPALWVSIKAPHQQLQAHALEDIVRKVGKRAGIRAYPHKLRHTFATIGLRNGMTVDQLQALLGHANLQTTMIYADQDKALLHMEHKRAFG